MVRRGAICSDRVSVDRFMNLKVDMHIDVFIVWKDNEYTKVRVNHFCSVSQTICKLQMRNKIGGKAVTMKKNYKSRKFNIIWQAR